MQTFLVGPRVLSCGMLRCGVCVVLCCVVGLHYVLLCGVLCNVLCSNVLCNVLCSNVLCNVLLCIVLCCVALSSLKIIS